MGWNLLDSGEGDKQTPKKDKKQAVNADFAFKVPSFSKFGGYQQCSKEVPH